MSNAETLFEALAVSDMTCATGGAIFSEDHRHRLWLFRHVPDGLLDRVYGRVLFFMLNPSKADASDNDMTVSKCTGFARRFGATRVGIINAFTLISTDPGGLIGRDANAPAADAMLEAAMHWLSAGPGGTAHALVFAYGKPSWWNGRSPFSRALAERVAFVRDLAACHGERPMALGVTAGGWPRHPSRLGYGGPRDHPQPVPEVHFNELARATA